MRTISPGSCIRTAKEIILSSILKMKYDVSEVKAKLLVLTFSINHDERTRKKLPERVINFHLICISAKWDLRERTSDTRHGEGCTVLYPSKPINFHPLANESNSVHYFMLSGQDPYPFPTPSTTIHPQHCKMK